MELRHDDEERRHVHEVGEDAQNERRLHERLPALEAVAGDGVGDRDDEEGGNDAAHRRHEEGVAEPPRIVVLVGLGEEAAEGIQAVTFGEEALERQKISFRVERRKHQPHAGEGEEKAHKKDEEVDERRFQSPLGAE